MNLKNCYIFFALIINFYCFAQQDEIIPDINYNFRSGHNLTLLLSSEYITWNVKQKYILSNNLLSKTQEILPIKDTITNASLFLRYTYDINLRANFGFFIGSTTGITLIPNIFKNISNFYPGNSIFFPTILAGFVQNIGARYRISTGIEYGAIWLPQMHIKDQANNQIILKPILDLLNIYLAGERFLNKNTTANINIGYRYMHEPCLNSCSKDVYLNSLDIDSAGSYLQIGFNWLYDKL